MKISVLAAGMSTFACQGSDSLDLTEYAPALSQREMLPVAGVLAKVPEVQRYATVQPAGDLAGDTLNPDPRQLWSQLAARIEAEAAAADGPDGFVVLHGTNTLEETAYLLHLVLKTDKPVVVTGAMRPITALSTDGPLNLVHAVRVAADPAARGRGVLVVLNGEIHSARHVTKTSTYGLDAFASPDAGPLGTVDADRPVYHQQISRGHTVQTPFAAGQIAKMPRVDIVYDYLGSDGLLVEAAVSGGAKGIVVAGAGAGALGGMLAALQAAQAGGVAVVRSSRVLRGRVLSRANHGFPGMISADSLDPQKARILLQLALTVSTQPARVQEMFDLY